MNQSPTIENNPPDGGFSARLAQLIQVLGMSQNEFSRRKESTSDPCCQFRTVKLGRF